MDNESEMVRETPPLIFVINMNELDIARHMIEDGVDVNQVDGFGYSPLRHAVNLSHLPLVQLLLDYGADPNMGVSPLHAAIDDHKEDTYDLCKLLLDNGAFCNIREAGFSGYTPFHVALSFRPLKYVKLLLNYGADIRSVCDNGETAVHLAAQNGHTDVMEFVLDHGFDVNCVEFNNNISALHYAAQINNSEGCELLLRHGAMVDAIYIDHLREKHTPLESCLLDYLGIYERGDNTQRHVRTVEVLSEYGANVTDSGGSRSALEIVFDNHYRFDLGFDEIRKIMLRRVAKMQYLNL